MSKQVLEVAGAVATSTAVVTKGTPSGEGAMFNHLPPGEDADMQAVSQVGRTYAMQTKYYVPGTPGYEGDGWDDVNGV